MKLIKRIAVISVLLFINTVMLLTISCVRNARVEPSLSQTPEIAETPTLQHTITPILSPSPIPTETPVPVIGFEEDITINQQIQDFLQYKGIYSLENIPNYLYRSTDSYYKLGIVYGIDDTYEIQGWLFGYTKQGDNLLLIVGFDSNKDDRFVTALRIPLYIEATHKIGGVVLTYQRDWNENTYHHSGGYTTDYEEIVSHLAWNQPFLSFYPTNVISDEEATKQGVTDESVIELLRDERENLQYVYNLFSRLNRNNKAISIPNEAVDYPIQDINSVSDIAELDYHKIPILYILVCIDG